jgi:ABC-type branched-subunit amino acid transport system substrate-binding protein
VGPNTDWNSLVRNLRRDRVDRVVLVGGSDIVLLFATAAAAERWSPEIYVLGALVGPQLFNLPEALERLIYVAYPNLPGAASEDALAEMRAALEADGRPVSHPAAQTSAMAAGKLLVETLRRTGRAVTREGFISALHSIIEFQTGLMPRLSYGPNRRIGVQGIYLLAFDPRTRSFGPAPEWITIPGHGGL